MSCTNTQTEYITMKKTLITLLALAGAAVGASETFIIGADGTENPWGYGNYVTHADTGVNSSPIVSGTLSSGITWDMKQSTGKTWIVDLDDNWSNQKALDLYNDSTGNSLTTTQITAGTLSASAAGGSKETITLNFENAASYATGDAITIFAFVGVNPSGHSEYQLTGMTITGLNEGYTVNVASNTGYGFDNTYSSAASSLSLVCISGTLSGNSVTIMPTGNKTGFAAVTVMHGTAIIPEPATATLSLLALAGLAARRRRH